MIWTNVIVASLVFVGTVHADEKLFRVEAGGRPSFLFAGRRRAWVEGVDRVPAQLRRAVERSRLVVFAEPIWDKAKMSERSRLRDRRIFTSGAGTIEQLSRSALESYVRLTTVEERAKLSHARPGVIFMIVQKFFDDYVRWLHFDEEGVLDEDTDTFVRDMSIQLFGRPLGARDLRLRSAKEMDRARAGVVYFDRAIYEIARARGVEIDDLTRFEVMPNVHEQYDRFVGVRELDRGLVHFGEMLATADDVNLRGSWVFGLIPGLIDADYLSIRNDPILRIEALHPRVATPGLESVRAHARSRFQRWREPLVERFSRGEVFVSIPLEELVGNPNLDTTGLKQLLEEEGLGVVPVELGCGRFLQ